MTIFYADLSFMAQLKTLARRGWHFLRRFWREWLMLGVLLAFIYGLVVVCSTEENRGGQLRGKEEWFKIGFHGWQWVKDGMQDQLGRTISLGKMIKDDPLLYRLLGSQLECFEQQIAFWANGRMFSIKRDELYQGAIKDIYWSLNLKKRAYLAVLKMDQYKYNLVLGVCGESHYLENLKRGRITVSEWSENFQTWRRPLPIYLTKAKSVYATVYFYDGTQLLDTFRFDEHGSWAWHRAWMDYLVSMDKFAAAYDEAVEEERLSHRPIPEDDLAKKILGNSAMKRLQQLRQIGDYQNAEEIITW